MRVSCLQENLAKGLAIVGRAVSSRSTMPVLANILIEASDNQLRLAATNLEIGVTCWIGAKVEDPGSITVPARLLTEFVNSLPPERIDMELTVRTQTLKLRCASFDANMKGIDAASFPDYSDDRGRHRRRRKQRRHDAAHRTALHRAAQDGRSGGLCRLDR